MRHIALQDHWDLIGHLESKILTNKYKMAKTRKMRSSRKGTRKISKWTAFVKKIYQEMKKKDKNVKLGAAMKEASRRKSEMK